MQTERNDVCVPFSEKLERIQVNHSPLLYRSQAEVFLARETTTMVVVAARGKSCRLTCIRESVP